MTTSKEKYCRQTGRARVIDFFSGDSTSRYNAFKWGGLLLLASVLLPLLWAGCESIVPTISGPRYSAAGVVPLAGTGVPGSLVEILDEDGNRLGKVTVPQNGIWSTQVPFEAGDHDLSVRTISRTRDAFDPDYPLVLAEGDEGRGMLTAFDTSTYAFSLPSGDVAPGLLTLAGAGVAGTVIKLFSNGVEIGETTVGPDGTWSFDTDLADAGDYDFSAEVYAPDGSLLGEIPSQSLTVMAPEPEFVPLAADGRASAGVFTTNDGATASGPVSWSGTGTPGSLIELYANGEKIGETFVNPDGEWSFVDIDMDLNLGNNLLSVRMLDGDGNLLGSPVTDTLLLRADSVVDNSVPDEPDVTEIAPLVADGLPTAGTFTTADGTTASGPVSWSGTGNPGSTVELWANGVKVGETVVDEDGNWSFDGLEVDLDIDENDLTIQMV